MTKAKHTPGPFKANYCSDYVMIEAAMVAVAEIERLDSNNDTSVNDEIDANIALFEAAPDLLEALVSIKNYPAKDEPRRTKDGYPEEIIYDEFAYKRMVNSYREAACAAIAKTEKI